MYASMATQGTQDEEKHRETGNIRYIRRRKTQQKHTVIKTKILLPQE
jgi:hypothetical protein